MKTCLTSCAVLVTLLTHAQAEQPVKEKKNEPAPHDKIYEVKIADLDEFVVKTDKWLFNNFSLTESTVGLTKGMATLKFFASCKNRTEGFQQYTVMVVGLDEKKGVLWATKTNSGTDGKGVGVIQDYTQQIPQGTLKATASVWMRVLVTENAPAE